MSPHVPAVLSRVSRRPSGVVLLIAAAAPVLFAQAYKDNLPADHAAIGYAGTAVNDPVATLSHQLDRGTLELKSRPNVLGYLPDLLGHLELRVDSQMLVFSKTSNQASKISPENPRAIYFNDDVVVAYVPGAQGLELAAIDPVQGPVFYAMTVGQSGTPTLARSQTCLRCHQGPNTSGVPGLYIGSVIPGPTGAPLRDQSAIITDHRSDFKDRWGGWYVTAKRGEQPDRANAVASDPADPATLVRESRQNLATLRGRFDASAYPAQTSDIVALMTFEHQTQMTNFITRVSWQARIEQHQLLGAGDCQGNTCVVHATGVNWQPTLAPHALLDAEIEELVSYMLFSGEAEMKAPIEGVSSFTDTFPQRGPRDHRGRSLRDFDLQTRLFRYPLSYMVYSRAFDALPDAARERVYLRLHGILSGKDQSPPFAHLSSDDRRAILEILGDTKPDLPAYWRTGVSRQP